MNKYSALIIGAGGQGALADAPGSGNEHKILSFAHALREHSGFDRIFFYDKDIKKAIKAALIWGGCWTDTYWTDDILELTKPVDIAVVSTPDDDHYEVLKKLAKCPLRLVICEKPLCTDIDKAREIVELYKSKNIPLMVAYQRRFIPELQDLKRRYEAGEFGRLYAAMVSFNRGFLHTGSHMVDFINWFFDRSKSLQIAYFDVPYRAWQIQFFFDNFFWQEQIIGDAKPPAMYDKQMAYIIDNAYQFLEGKEPLKCTGEDAFKALEICFKAMEGAKTKNYERNN